MKAAVAGVNVVNAVSSSATRVIHMDTLLVSVISSAGVMTTVVVSASALPAWAWELVPTATEEIDEKVTPKAAEESAAFLLTQFQMAQTIRGRTFALSFV
jgi:hypothetical protein